MNRLIPNRLGFAHFAGDLTGGVTAAVVALPLALAFGVASGAGPMAGLYGAICTGFFASLFGGTASQISGPTGPMTIVSATLFTQFGETPAVAFTVVMMAGALQILFGYLGIGRYVNLMPYPVISGFMTGIGCILILMQLDPALGYAASNDVINVLSVLPENLVHPKWNAAWISAVALGICFFTPAKLNRVLPAPLLALAIGTGMALLLSDVQTLGAIPNALPRLSWPSIEPALIGEMLSTAAVLAALGSIDSLLTSLVADNATTSYHDSDKELVGQGMGNLFAGLLGGIPGAGATIRTLTNVNAGGVTPLSGMCHAVVLLAIALGLGPIVSFLPQAALAGVLLKVGIDVIDWGFLRRLHRMPPRDLFVMILVLMLTVFVDVIMAVGVGVVLASLAFVKDAADQQKQSIKLIHSEEHDLLDEEEVALLAESAGRTLILHLSGLMSFGAANQMTRRVSALDQYEVLVIDLHDVPLMDVTASLALEEVINRAEREKMHVIVVGLRFTLAKTLGRLGVLDSVRETERFGSLKEALVAASGHVNSTAEEPLNARKQP